MKDNRKFRILSVLTVTALLLSLVAETVYFSEFEYRLRAKMFSRNLLAKEKIMEDCLEDMRPILAQENHHGSNNENNIFSTAENNRISILEYLGGNLVYWSDNEFEVPSVYSDSIFSKPIVFLQNGWFLTKKIEAGNEKVIGLLRVHTDYSFENNIIKSGFEKGFRMPPNVDLSLKKGASPYGIYDRHGNFLFSLVFPALRTTTSFIFLPLFFWSAFFVLLILLVIEAVKILAEKGLSVISIAVVFIAFSLIYFFVLVTGRPHTVFLTELFLPYRFSLNSFMPSLGHLLVFSILGSSFIVVFFRYFEPSEDTFSGNRNRFLIHTAGFMTGALLLSLFQAIFAKLISTSTINFETYKVLDLNMFSAAGFLSMFMLLIIPGLFLLKFFRICGNLTRFQLLIALMLSLVVPLLLFIKEPVTFVAVALFYIIMVLILRIISEKKIGIFNITVFFSVLSGVYFLIFISILSEKKQTENIQIQAVSFSTENDPEAEHLLLDMWPVMEQDQILAGMMKVTQFHKENYDRILNYIQDNYFTGFWKNYHFSLVLCHQDQSLQVGTGEKVQQNCFSFFDDRIRANGHRLTNTNFYFLDNQGGRAYYLCRALFNAGDSSTNGMFIELYNDVNVFQPGYSELLLDKRYHGYSGLKDYSFAKYINGDIVLRSGDFPFDKTDAGYLDKVRDFRIFRQDGFKHVLYRNGNSTVIISRPVLSAGDIIISFAYLFAFILLFSNLIVIFVRRPGISSLRLMNFRQKIQLSYIVILLFSFVLIGVVVAYITVGQYKTKHYENIKEKLNSVYLELDSRLSMEKVLTPDWRNSGYASLNDFLIKLSNVFNTDINLYDLRGFLIASSRQEIFNRNLTSERIDNMAFINLDNLTKSEYYHTERIGRLNYLSAYVPFFNADNNAIAYLNIPYFRMQSVLAKEISNMIVAVINFALLLIVITMSLAVFISGRLTSPLAMLGKGLATVGIGRKSEHLTYEGHDEIGELVKQYNRMVDEIEISAHKLADSEREYAWREMAKQIAHEIKNPLTPMKLNVQQLHKSWKDKAPDFDKLIERFSKNQIEYIDDLSSIATAFSSFAKMPVSNPVEVNILEQAIISLDLFKNTENVTFSTKWPHESKIIVYADKEQLNGVFSNLIKNGIQAMTDDKPGEIGIAVNVVRDKVIVSVSDNGSGIPDILRKKLFTPNFTTKSSGSGLGLSIVKKYLESANGRIWFDSETGKGTTFFFELPVMYTVEKPGKS